MPRFLEDLATAKLLIILDRTSFQSERLVITKPCPWTSLLSFGDMEHYSESHYRLHKKVQQARGKTTFLRLNNLPTI